MSLHFIFGASGAGKSYTIYQKIIKESIENPMTQYLVLVPEQFTMQTQKDLVLLHPRKGILNIDVLSFERLAYRVFGEVGETCSQILEETGKSLVLRKVAQLKKKELKFLGEKMNKQGYISSVKSMVSELKQYEITKETMDELLEETKNRPELYYKLKDLSVLYQGFFEFLEGSYITQEELLDVLGQVLKKSERVKDSVVVLDGYTGFTPVQLSLLEKLLPQCRTLYVTVTLPAGENPYQMGKPHHLFHLSKETVHRLMGLAKKTGVPAEESWVLENGRFSQNPPMAFLEQNLFRRTRNQYKEDQKAVHIRECGSPQEEMEETALLIHRMIRERGYRCRDFAVITGDLETYADDAARAFQTYGLTCFIDRKKSVFLNPFVEFLRASVDLAVDNFSYESVFRLLRCGFLDLTDGETDKLENYVVGLGIRGTGKWKEEWTFHYRGQNPEEVPVLETIRKQLMEVWEPFIDAFKQRGGSVRERSTALYDYVSRCHIQEKLKRSEEDFKEDGRAELAKEYNQIYPIVMDLLDKMVDVLGEEKVSLREYRELLEAGLSEMKVGIIPPGTDQVLVGDMERTRLKDIKVLFFAGVNEGKIPRSSQAGTLLSDRNREELKNCGVTLAPTSKENLFTQYFYLYLNLTKPSEELHLSYSRGSGQGEAMTPAFLIGEVKKLFPGINLECMEKVGPASVETPINALSVLAAGMKNLLDGEADAYYKELFCWYLNQEEWKQKVEILLDGAGRCNPKDAIGKSVAQALYGKTLENSATRLEQFARCACAHFLSYGLQLKERAQYEFNAMDMGNVLHGSLEKFAKKVREQGYDWNTLTVEKGEQLSSDAVDEVLSFYGNAILKSSARSAYMETRVKRMMNRTIWGLLEQLRKGEFVPDRFEVSFAMADGLDSVNLILSEEEQMRLKGRIDRVDICEDEEHVYVKVIDYKSGNTSFDLVALYHGLQIQLALYMNAAVELEQREHPDKEVIPAGIFYYNIKDPVIEQAGAENEETLQNRLLKELKMNGLVLDERDLLVKLDSTLKENGTSSFSVPAALNKDGSLSRYSSAVNREQFQLISNYVQQKMKEIGRRILDGEAEAAPYEMGKQKACQYCPYQGVCGFDEKTAGYGYRRLSAFKTEEIWEKMKSHDDEKGKEA